MKALVVCKHSENNKKADTCKIINKKNLQIIYSWKNTLTKENLNNIDFVISIGGDGTALSASHYLTKKPLLAINSSPETSEGALTTISLPQLNNKLNQILENKHEIEKLERIQVKINNTLLPLIALNDVFIGNIKSYLISKYKIQFKDTEETQMSSGLIFSTGTGSTAWFRSAGGRPFSPQSRFIKMIIREPYKGKLSSPELTKLTIKENEKITIILLVKSILAIDSIREYSLNPNDKIQIEISKHPLIRIK